MMMTKNGFSLLKGLSIFLIGMMGTGKTTVGKVLAQELGYRFFDSDDLITKISQQSINEIFETAGEDYFRLLETKILAELAPYTQSVVATGGGIVLKPENWGYLRHGLIIWLDVPVDLLVQRLQADDTRPLLKDSELHSKLKSLLDKRRSLYQEADLHIVIDSAQTPEAIVSEIITQIPMALKP